MKFSAIAFFTTAIISVLAAPTNIKRTDDANTPASPLGGANSILGVLTPFQSNIQGLLSQLSPPADGSSVDPSQVTSVVSQITTQLNSLTNGLGLLNGLSPEELLGGASKETVAQKVAGLANEVTGGLSKVEGVIANAVPQLRGPLTDLNTALQGVINGTVDLVNDLNALLTPLLAPITGILKSLGLGNLLDLGLLGL